jgi:hypothetical protein
VVDVVATARGNRSRATSPGSIAAPAGLSKVAATEITKITV